jgi:serine protease Do
MTLLQTNAAVNSGNSGGGLFNDKGELIGIVNAKVGGTTVEGMGFAIPSATVVKCINDLNAYGYITGKARLGISVYQYVTIGYMQYNMIQVSDVNPSGSAANSGLLADDIIYALNGTEIDAYSTLTELLTKFSVGDTITLTVLRPTQDASKASSIYAFLNSCDKIDLQITFIEFNPNV